ncbi:hypothetical protein H4R33_000138 [Dimargaris cristalligena]|uniref:Autophagy-related protein 101 n=1 Tax=Dimargaris cristalligena TaxID=215637 RepID=A0A4Q0A4H8_9FUNG|nr:hypothetical protein H4R33_000138 [Dimargaris cristalligena]RKP40481.1 hypothetical protein BJ085DRAFT_37765 [Dimargaris cristalligena]|eukprot:RKP40481.1 hypothetical protein BJ085DRAFT_37765 [Dimargaris cristalligena]
MAQSSPSIPTFILELSLEPRIIQDTVKAILHAIVFHRIFDNVRPREFTTLDIPCVAVDNPEVHEHIQEKAEAFSSMFQGDPSRSKGEEKRPKKAWFGKQEEPSWEKWVIAITTRTANSEREFYQMKPSLEAQLLEAMYTVVRIANEYKEHIPPITANTPAPFPFQVVLPTVGDSWSSMFKRI